jgi:tRNA(Ile)-lysidine synthase
LTALTRERFATLMAALGPFETAPVLAVAVSGGADSLALTLLAAEWAAALGGAVVALTVDHGLRAESAAEAAQVGSWLADRGIRHHVLTWRQGCDGPDLQAKARAARYDLLESWCRDHHILHLLLAHHQEDQAETFLLRLGRGSGVDGLAAMAPLVFHQDVQLLRPLLAVSRTDLRATLRTLAQDWIEDPSNRANRFARVRWRALIDREGLSAARLAVTAGQLGRARHALEADHAALAVDAVQLHPAGFAWLDLASIRQAPEELALRLLASVTRSIGGRHFPPRLDGLLALQEEMRAGLGRRRTFAGCVLAPMAQGCLVFREDRGLAPPVLVPPDAWCQWDRRFSLRQSGPSDLRLGGLGRNPPPEIVAKARELGIPEILLPTLPAIMDKRGILAVPPLGYDLSGTGSTITGWGFTPAYPLAGAGFRLVKASARTM